MTENYREFASGKKYCMVHKCLFNDFCEKCSIGNKGCKISLRNEGSLNTIEVSKNNPLVSYGKLKNSKKVVSKQDHGKITVNHGKSRLLNRHRKIYQRFHSYRKKFNAVIDFDSIDGNIVRLNNNVCFKRLEYPEATVQVFRKSILLILRSSMEVKGQSVIDAKDKSDKLMAIVISKLPRSIRLLDSKVVEVHNAFVNHPTAKHNVTVKVDGATRLISDNSHGNHEFEAIHPEFVVSDSLILERFNHDLITNNPELLSVQSQKMSYVVSVLEKYAHQMDLHLDVESKSLSVQDKTSKNLDLMYDALETLTASVSNLKEEVTTLIQSQHSLANSHTTNSKKCAEGLGSSSISPRTISKCDDLKTIEYKKRLAKRELAKKYLREYGWSDSMWGD